MFLFSSCSAYTIAAMRTPMRAPVLSMNANPTKEYKRAEVCRNIISFLNALCLIPDNCCFIPGQFWEEETATVEEIANVLGRWESCTEWADRVEFSVVTKAREEQMAQGSTVERHDYARRNGLVERVALAQNAPKLPFTNAKLAASFGKTVEEFDAMPVSQTAVNIVYDSLAQSKTGLLPEKTVDERRQSWFTTDGGFDDGAIAAGLYKSRVAVTVGWLLLGKGQLYGACFAGRIALDVTGSFDLIKEILGPYTEPIYWVLSFAVAGYAIFSNQQVAKNTADYETFSKEEAEERDKLVESDGVLEKMGKRFEAGNKQ